MLNHYQYYCPYCDSPMNDQGMVEFRLVTSSNETTIYLNPNPGEYDYKCEPEVELKLGEKHDFYCKACNANLHSNRFPDFVQIKMRATSEIEFDILFARACGQHCTYVMTEDMVEKHGDHPQDLI